LGRKVHPIGFRLGFTKDWQAKWYAEGKDYADFLQEDLSIRDFIRERMEQAGISQIEIERFHQQVFVRIWTAKPGILIGRRGAKVKELRQELERLTGKKVHIEIEQIEKPELDAYLVAKNIASQLEKRISHSRAMKVAAQRAMDSGAKGVKILCGGRLAGAEMARREWVMEGRVPRNTLRADIDFAQAEALTTYGRIGVRVWIYKGDLMPGAEKEKGE
jgi:small subunit ribosomal protein S3